MIEINLQAYHGLAIKHCPIFNESNYVKYGIKKKHLKITVHTSHKTCQVKMTNIICNANISALTSQQWQAGLTYL